MERLGARLQPRAPARAHELRRHARRRLARAGRDALHRARNHDPAAARLVAAPRWRGPTRCSARGARSASSSPRAASSARRAKARATTPSARRARCRRAAQSCASAARTSACATARAQCTPEPNRPATPGARAARRMKPTRTLLVVLAAARVACVAKGSYGERTEVQEFIRGLALKHGFAEQELQLPFFPRAPRRAGARGDQAAAAEKRAPGRNTAQFRSTKSASPRGSSSGGSTAARWSARRRATACRRSTSSPSSAWRLSTGATPAAGAWSTRSPRSPSTTGRAPQYFKGELEQYLLLAREQGKDAFAMRGSYAGAIGIPQFMPSSTAALRGRLRRQRRDRPAPQPGRRHRQRGELPQGARLAAQAAECCSARRSTADAWRPLADGSVDPKHAQADLRAAGVEFEAACPRACARSWSSSRRRTSRATIASACTISG